MQKKGSILNSLRIKIFLILLGLALVVILSLGLISAILSSNSLKHQTFNQLEAVQKLKRSHLLDLYDIMENQLHVLKDDPYIRNALIEFYGAFVKAGKTTESVQWKNLLKKYDSRFKDIKQDNEWTDVFLIHTNGEIVYTVDKRSDLGMTITESELINSTLGRAFTSIRNTNDQDKIAISDFGPYSPNNGLAASFMIAQIRDEKNSLKGYVAFQISMDKINAVMQLQDGMGKSGSSYIVGLDSDGNTTLKNDRIIKNEKAGKIKSDPIIRKCLFENKEGKEIKIGSTGKKELVAYNLLPVGDLKWGIFSTMAVEEINEPVKQLIFWIALTGAIILFVSILIAIYFSNMISKPLLKISGRLKKSSSLIAKASIKLSNSSQQLATSSQAVASTSQQIAGGSSQQASSIEETTSSVEELSSMVKQNAGNATEAANLSNVAMSQSENGYHEMENMYNSMMEINKSSDEIKKVIKVIDDIAFQTNILALNAAVEAARAGEAGMGFAVVADEVKNLANKSADAAKETADMIEESIRKSQSGLSIATKLLDVFKEILHGVKKVSEVAKEVEVASNEQDSGLDQVNKAIIQLDTVVQSNAASAEELAGSSEQLTSTSEESAASAKIMLTQANTLGEIVNSLMELITGRVQRKVKRHQIIEADENQELQTEIATGVEVKDQQQLGFTGKDHKSPTVHKAEDVIPFENDDEFENF